MIWDQPKIGHMFNLEKIKELKIGGGDFLLPSKEEDFRRMLERHGKAFTFIPKEFVCVDPKVVESMVFFTTPHIPGNLTPKGKSSK
mgnify:CR=1 FL=1